jgi:hypothetical protein
MTQPNAVVRAAMAAKQAAVPEDKLMQIKGKVSEVRDLERQISNLQERLELARKKSFEIQTSSLPNLFDEVGITELGIPAEGNSPAYTARLLPVYRANIAMDWDAGRREAALDYLKSNGYEDLIKVQVTVNFKRGEIKAAQQFAANLAEQFGVDPDVKESVHSATLSSWLRECVEERHEVPDLEKIGGYIGREVKLRQKK